MDPFTKGLAFVAIMFALIKIADFLDDHFRRPRYSSSSYDVHYIAVAY